MKPFFQCSLSFLGFAPEEQKHMEELTLSNGKQLFSSLNDLSLADVLHRTTCLISVFHNFCVTVKKNLLLSVPGLDDNGFVCFLLVFFFNLNLAGVTLVLSHAL